MFHNEEPITIERVAEQIEYLGLIDKLTFTVVLTHCFTTNHTKIVEPHVFFDSFRPISCKTELVPVAPISKFSFQLPSCPTPPKKWTDLKDDPHREYWYSSIMERYTKNYRVRLWSIPVSCDCLPPNSNMLQVVSTFNIKLTSVENIYNF